MLKFDAEKFIKELEENEDLALKEDEFEGIDMEEYEFWLATKDYEKINERSLKNDL